MPLSAAAASLIGAGIAATSSAASTYAGSRATTNLNGKNRAWQQAMMQKEMDYNTEMWNKSNEYNSASAQRSRLEQAGINPYMMVDGGSAGTATAQSAPSTGSPQTFNPDYSGYGSGVSNAVNQALQGYQLQLLNEQTRGQKLKNDSYNVELIERLKNIAADTNSKEWDSTLKDVENNYRLETFNSNVLQQQRSAELLEEQIQTQLQQSLNLQIQNGILAKELNNWDDTYKTQMAQVVAQTELAISQKKLNEQEGFNVMCNAYKTLAEKQGIEIDNETARRTQNDVVRKMHHDANAALHNANNQYLNSQSLRYNNIYLGKKIGAYDTDKWFDRVGTVLNGATNTYDTYKKYSTPKAPKVRGFH